MKKIIILLLILVMSLMTSQVFAEENEFNLKIKIYNQGYIEDASDSFPIEGGEFTVFANQDICLKNGQMYCQKWLTVTKLICDENGYAESDPLPRANYVIQQTGRNLKYESKKDVICIYFDKDDSLPVYTYTTTVLNKKIKVLKSGDVNRDGNIDMLDARLAKRIAMKQNINTFYEEYAGDLDDDGRITINEARHLKRYLLREIKNLY